MADLAQTESSGPMPMCSDKEKGPSYPCLTLRDDNVEKVKGDQQCELGEEYTATVRLRVKGLSSDEYGERLEFDVLTMDDFSPADGQEYKADEPNDQEGDQADDQAEGSAPDEPSGKKSSKAMTYS